MKVLKNAITSLMVIGTAITSMACTAKATERTHGEDVYVPDEITSVFSAPDYYFPDSKNYLIFLKTDKSALKGILPEGFKFIPGHEDVVMVRVNRFHSPEKNIRPYWETVISVPATFGEGDNAISGEYASQLYLGSIEAESNVTPTLTGQMLYGYPKREAIFDVNGEFGSGSVNIDMSRHNNLLLDLDIKEKEADNTVDPSLIRQGPMMVFKAIPDASGTGWDALEVNIPLVKEGSFTLKEMRAVNAQINGDLKLDSGRVIPVKEITGAVYLNFDWTLGKGKLVHDYLNN